MTLLIVTSKYPPQMCGVGDYSALLVDRLRELGYSVDVYTSGSEGIGAEPGVFRGRDWSAKTTRDLACWIGQQEYSHVLLQYTPMGYSRKGAFPPIVLLPRLLQKTSPQCRVVTTLHELFYVFRAFEPERIPRNLTIGAAQRLSLAAVAGESSALVVTTGERCRFVAGLSQVLRWRSRDSLYEIPVGTNIEPVAMTAADRDRLIEEQGLLGKTVLGSFSTAADPSLLLAALAATRTGGRDVRLLAVGVDPDFFRQRAAKLFEELAPYVICTGKVSAVEVSQFLQMMDIYLLPLQDGISVRRGTLLAALAHGLPIVGTAGRSTDSWMRDCPAFRLTPAGNKAAFTQAVKEVAGNPAQKQALRGAAAALFQESYTWEVIARRYQAIIEKLS